MKLTVRHVSIPMRYRFGHARAGRSAADNIIVEVELRDGARGWGESVPRDYVTGETIVSVFAGLAAALARPDLFAIEDADDFATVSRVLAAIDLPREIGVDKAAPAAAAALELALLDVYARREKRALIDAIALSDYASLLAPTPAAHVRQTLTIGDELEAALDRAGSLRETPDVKVKLGFGIDKDRARIEKLRERFGATMDLRGDANAAWERDNATEALRAFGVELSSVEEPLSGRDLAGCAILRNTLGTRVMLDESLCTVADATAALEAGAADLFNLRLSKCGGLFGTLRLVACAESANLGWQLGCMVGESGILSSLGRAFVGHVRGARYFETTVPSKSLETDLTDAKLDHLAETRLTPVPRGPGFGAKVDVATLERYTVARLVIDR